MEHPAGDEHFLAGHEGSLGGRRENPGGNLTPAQTIRSPEHLGFSRRFPGRPGDGMPGPGLGFFSLPLDGKLHILRGLRLFPVPLRYYGPEAAGAALHRQGTFHAYP